MMAERRDRYFRWLLAHRGRVLLAAATVLTVSAFGAGRVRIDYTIEQLFPARGESRQTFDEYKQAFPREDLRFSLIWRDTRAPGVHLYRDMQRAAREFEKAGLLDVHWIGSVSVAEAEWIDGEAGLRIHPLVEESRLTDRYVQNVLVRYRDERLYRGYLWNADQTSFAIHGYLDEHSADDRTRREIEEALSDGLAALDLESVETALGGIPVFRSRLPKLLESDQRLLLGGGFLLFALILFLFFRSITHIVFCLASAIPAYLVTIGVMGHAGMSISVLTSFIPIIVLVVSVSDSIHLLARFRTELNRTGESADRPGTRRREAVARTFSHLAVPCFYTSLTTAVGFLSLVGTRIGIVMEFGAFTALAILVAFGFSMTVLPVLLSIAPIRKLDDRGLRIRWIQWIVNAAAHLAVRPSRVAIGAFVGVGLLGLAAATTLRTNTLLMDDLRPRSSLLRDIHWIERNGYGLFQVNLYLRTDSRGPLHDPAALAWMREFQEHVSADPLVIGTLGLPDYIEQLRTAMADEGEIARPLPESREEASQLLFMAELQDAGFAQDVYHREDGEAQVLVTVRDKGSVVILPFLDRIDRYLADNPPPVGSVKPTGTVYLLQSYQARILQSFGPSLLIALVVITGILIYMFRSWRYGLLALLPNLFPLVVLLGVMKLGSFDLKPSTILVFSIAFGIAADDTIHMLSRFRQSIASGMRVRTALVDSVRDAGPAILMTTMVVGAGFSLLMASQFEVLFLVGLMTAVSAISAVTADLFALPSILAVRGRLFTHGSSPAAPARAALDIRKRRLEASTGD
jgi:predicted RND superfamily exporter protein